MFNFEISVKIIKLIKSKILTYNKLYYFLNFDYDFKNLILGFHKYF
jgi:hypothetical protein